MSLLAMEALDMDAHIMKLSSIEKVRRFKVNATRLERPELIVDCNRREVELSAASSVIKTTTDVEKACLNALCAYEVILHQKHGKTVKATHTRRAVVKKGIIRAVEDAVLKGIEHTQSDILELHDAGMMDMSFEQVVHDYPDAFCTEAINAANLTLQKYASVGSAG